MRIEITQPNGEVVDITPYLPQPAILGFKLDESLDLAHTSIKNTPFEKAFTPLSAVTIYLDDNTPQYFVMAEDVISDNFYNGTYDHDLNFIEETKILERKVSDTKTYTQPLNNDLRAVIEPTKPIPEIITNTMIIPVIPFTNNGITSKTQAVYTIPYDTNSTITCKAPSYYFDLPSAQVRDIINVSTQFTITFMSYTGQRQVLYDQTDTGNLLLGEYTTQTTDYVINASARGTYILHYKTQATKSIPTPRTGRLEFTVTLTCIPTSEIEDLVIDDYTIWDACDILLKTYETIRVDETQDLTLYEGSTITADPYYYTKAELQAIRAPEFTFTKMTLWEAFSIIGQKIHAIPKLENGVVKFQRLDVPKYAVLADPSIEAKYLMSQSGSWSNEQFCSEIDTNVDNLVDVDNIAEGSITEPFSDIYQTPRAESGNIQLTTEDCFIRTRLPIERIIKIELGRLPNGAYGGNPVGDITKYVMEIAEYNALSSYTTTFPSKAMALTYTYGERNITGLTFRAENVWANVFNLPIFNNYAIWNIISDKTGIGVDVIKQLFTDVYDLKYLQFKITYIPRISGRVKQSKTYVNDIATKSTITVNQQANVVSNEYFGESIKGIVARYGNPEIQKVFYLPRNDTGIARIPKIGEKWGKNVSNFNVTGKGYIVSEVNTEWYYDFIKVEVHLSKNFNRYNQYVGADNTLRKYEVSEKQAYEREPIYQEYLVLSYDNNPLTFSSPSASLIQSDGLSQIMNSFIYNHTGNPIDRILVQGYTEDNDPISAKYTLPIVALGVGNSMYYKFNYADNYSAGDSTVPAISSNITYTLQQLNPYSDYWGRIAKLRFDLGNGTNEDYDFETSYNIGNALPNYQLNIGHYLMRTNVSEQAEADKAIQLYKDNREIINCDIALHFATDDRQIIIGSALARTNGTVSNQTTKYKLYILPNEISGFMQTVDLTSATYVGNFDAGDITVDAVSNVWRGAITKTFTANDTGSAWVLVDEDTNAFIMGRNMSIVSGYTEIAMPYIYAVRKIKYKGD